MDDPPVDQPFAADQRDRAKDYTPTQVAMTLDVVMMKSPPGEAIVGGEPTAIDGDVPSHFILRSKPWNGSSLSFRKVST
jgi:hypothetical protein